VSNNTLKKKTKTAKHLQNTIRISVCNKEREISNRSGKNEQCSLSGTQCSFVVRSLIFGSRNCFFLTNPFEALLPVCA